MSAPSAFGLLASGVASLILDLGKDQADVMAPVLAWLAGDGDRQIGHVGEVRQSHPPRLVSLAEDHRPPRAMVGAPGAHPPLHRVARAQAGRRTAQIHLFKDGHRPQDGRRLQHRHDLAVPDGHNRFGPPWAATSQLDLSGRASGWRGRLRARSGRGLVRGVLGCAGGRSPSASLTGWQRRGG